MSVAWTSRTSSGYYSAFASLPSEALALMLRELRTDRRAQGRSVVREGQPPGSMYIVEDGKLRAYKKVGRRNTRRRVPPQGRLLRRGLDAEARATRGDGRSRHGRPAARARREDVHEAAEDRPGVPGADRQRVAQYDYRTTANVPLDFAEEILPAAASARESVTTKRASEERTGRGRTPGGDRRGPVRQAVAGASAASRSCTSSTRWTAAPRASRWSRATSDVPSAISHIRDAVGVSADGTSLLGITEGAKSLGLAARSVKASKSRLDDMPLPAVVALRRQPLGRRPRRRPAPRPHRRSRDRAPAHEAGGVRGRSGAATPRCSPRHPRSQNAPVQTSKSRWIWEFVRPHRATLLRATLLALVSAGLAMLIPVFSQLIVDRVVANGTRTAEHRRRSAMVGVLVAADDRDDHAALPAEPHGRDDRRERARLHHGQAPRPPDELLQLAADGRHLAPAHRVPPGARVPRPAGRPGAHRGDAARRRDRPDVRVQPVLALVFLAVVPGVRRV